jgi:hypothetical protein
LADLTLYAERAVSQCTPTSASASVPQLFRLLLVAGIFVSGVIVGAWFQRSTPALPRETVLQHTHALPAPRPLPLPALPAPTITVSPPAPPRLVQIPPPRPSLWEIRAQLKRRLGEFEFPYYVNAPIYGSGPGPAPIDALMPSVAQAVAQ